MGPLCSALGTWSGQTANAPPMPLAIKTPNVIPMFVSALLKGLEDHAGGSDGQGHDAGRSLSIDYVRSLQLQVEVSIMASTFSNQKIGGTLSLDKYRLDFWRPLLSEPRWLLWASHFHIKQ